MSEVKRIPCRFCLNARSDPDHELTDTNDLSYLSVRSVDDNFNHAAMHIRSGDSFPVTVVVSAFDEWLDQRIDVAFYLPKFCPECGRPLMDDYPERRFLYGQESQ